MEEGAWSSNGVQASYQNDGVYDDGSGHEHYALQNTENSVMMENVSSSSESGLSGEALFRSERMALCQLFLQSEAAYACVSELGELGLVQFRDLNADVNAFQRKFVMEVRRCDEMERKLRFLEKEIKKDAIPMMEMHAMPEAPQPREMIDLEATFEKLEQEVNEVNANSQQLKKNFLELTELKHILRKTQHFFDEQHDASAFNDNAPQGQHQQLIPEENNPQATGLQLGFVAGVILRERLPAFERMLWRACRGNVFLRQAEIEELLEDPATGGEVLKSVFVIFFQGEQLKSRVKKICEGFRATLYPCPDQASDRREMAVGVMQRLDDLNTVLGQTNDHRHRVLVAAAKNTRVWFIKVRKIKAIYHTLNLFNLDVTQKCLIAECWVPVADIESIQMALMRGTEKSGSSIAPILNQMPTNEQPPTFFRTNKFTSAFQELINVYAVPEYREANPAVYTIITFPFLFSVMFGDLGHGIIMCIFALWMCLKEKQLEARKIDSEIWRIFFAGRYLIALMSFFSIYAGLLYNDIFSKSINIFGSSWFAHQSPKALLKLHTDMISPSEERGWYGSPYPFGIDPIWQVSENKIIFLNAFKMKLSIILGVTHMTFGVLLSYWNYKYFNKAMEIMTDFVPQIIFLSSLFGYLALMVLIKWSTYFANDSAEDFGLSERCAPSILITFINMILMRPNEATDESCDAYMFTGQAFLQRLLLMVALVCVPWMLLAKPLILRKQHRLKSGGQMAAANGGYGATEGQGNAGTTGSPGGDEFNFSELMIMQAIHTIEFVLGSVSHTASYLRLWALSLAHAQLSDVLWMMVLRNGLNFDKWYGGVMLWAIFAFWAGCTVAILCVMEGMSAFLHTLRLHWVEFESKFHHGGGVLFVPFAFEAILKQAEAAD